MKNERRQLLTFYHEMLFKPDVKRSLSEGFDRQMHTLARALDSLVEGDLARVGDILMGWYKALKSHTQSGTWDIASELEALPKRDLSLTSEEELSRITALQLRKARLRQSLQAVQKQSLPAPG